MMGDMRDNKALFLHLKSLRTCVHSVQPALFSQCCPACLVPWVHGSRLGTRPTQGLALRIRTICQDLGRSLHSKPKFKSPSNDATPAEIRSVTCVASSLPGAGSHQHLPKHSHHWTCGNFTSASLVRNSGIKFPTLELSAVTCRSLAPAPACSGSLAEQVSWSSVAVGRPWSWTRAAGKAGGYTPGTGDGWGHTPWRCPNGLNRLTDAEQTTRPYRPLVVAELSANHSC